MNEQLTVKNFGPIKDATVDFKRVTVFIGPTGGGKSTLAKLAAVFRDEEFFFDSDEEVYAKKVVGNLSLYGIQNFRQLNTDVQWKSHWFSGGFGGEHDSTYFSSPTRNNLEKAALPKFKALSQKYGLIISDFFTRGAAFHFGVTTYEAGVDFWKVVSSYFSSPKYIPADRVLAAFVTGSTFILQNQKIGISSVLIDFLSDFETARNSISQDSEFVIPFLDASYYQSKGKQLVKVRNSNGESIIPLSESASGFQSLIPLLLIVSFDSKHFNNSFIIEEPELNLYPTAQQGLMNWLIEKCTKGENDLTITTHSPYILSHLNLLLYAYQVATNHPERADEVAQIVPRESWINPEEFACYQVEKGGVKSLVNEELGLIDNNELDALSGDAADAFDNLIRLSKGIAVK